MSEVQLNSKILDYHLSQIEEQMTTAFEKGENGEYNYTKVAELAMVFFALFKGLEGCTQSQQRLKIVEELKSNNADHVGTYNKKWKLVAGIASGSLFIIAGGVGVASLGAPFIPGALGEALKMGGGASQSISGIGTGCDGITNTVFSTTEGERVLHSGNAQLLTSERDAANNAEEAAKNAKNQAWESSKAQRESRQAAMREISRG